MDANNVNAAVKEDVDGHRGRVGGPRGKGPMKNIEKRTFQHVYCV